MSGVSGHVPFSKTMLPFIFLLFIAFKLKGLRHLLLIFMSLRSI